MSQAPDQVQELTHIFNAADISRLKGMKLNISHLAYGQKIGLHLSRMHGFSSEFIDHRPYNPGEDPKHVDWKLFARSDRLYTKRYIEETDQTHLFILDVSASMYYPPESESVKFPGKADVTSAAYALQKRLYASRLAALLGYMAYSQADNWGAVFYDSEHIQILDPATGDSQWNTFIHLLASGSALFTPASKISSEHPFTEVITRLGSILTRPSSIFLFSDLFISAAFPEEILSALRLLRLAGHDVVVFHTLHSDELTFPFSSPTQFIPLGNLERRTGYTDGHDAVRNAYLTAITSWCDTIRTGCAALGIRYFGVTPDTSAIETILKIQDGLFL